MAIVLDRIGIVSFGLVRALDQVVQWRGGIGELTDEFLEGKRCFYEAEGAKTVPVDR
jgi:hypothetical protein